MRSFDLGLVEKETFVCFDCESTGLDPKRDRIIEIGAVRFTFKEEVASFESLVNPRMPIPAASQAIHHISDEMVKDAPSVDSVLKKMLPLTPGAVIVGHSIEFDIALVTESAKNAGVPCTLSSLPFIDTLRLARLYGESPLNSLQGLRRHFNIPDEGAHRALSDVRVNIALFKHLVKKYKTTAEILKILEKPIAMRAMPLGKYKGRDFKEIPSHYLTWASHQDFDRDLVYSLRRELKRRRSQDNFSSAANPFSEL